MCLEFVHTVLDFNTNQFNQMFIPLFCLNTLKHRPLTKLSLFARNHGISLCAIVFLLVKPASEFGCVYFMSQVQLCVGLRREFSSVRHV